MNDSTHEYQPSTWKKMGSLFWGILYTPFVPARFLFRMAIFIGSRFQERKNLLKFVFRSSDIFIVTYPKSGTTWMQMILYQLTTDGDMDFEHISEVSPWLESVLIFPDDNIESMPEPRLIKSHFAYNKIPKTPCKYIYVTRDGRDAMVSAYHQVSDYMGLQTNFSRFFKSALKGRNEFGSWFKHVHDWARNTDNLNVLYIGFEDLKKDPETEIRRIADFCEIELDDARLNRVLERTTFAFMREYEKCFGPEPRSSITGKKINQKKGAFIRKGKTGGWSDYFTEEMRNAYREEYKKWFDNTDASLLKSKINLSGPENA